MHRDTDHNARRDEADVAPTVGVESERPVDPVFLELLTAAAESAAAAGVDLDTFMSNAWAAFMEARPGLREQIEHIQLVAQLESLRQAGKLGQA